MPERRILIDPLSMRSLRIEVGVGHTRLSRATGFVVRHGWSDYLITNWHVVAGRDPDTDKCLSPTAAIPDTINIVHHARGRLGALINVLGPLTENGRPLWLEHPGGKTIDVVALPLRNLPAEIETFPLDLSLADTNMRAQPAMAVSIIGYPLGLAVGDIFPIWKIGHIASDPDVDYAADKPAFLIDATTRSGMSGSPVVARASSYQDSSGNQIMGAGLTTKFLGVYSGHLHNAELGMVWRPSVIAEILAQAS